MAQLPPGQAIPTDPKWKEGAVRYWNRGPEFEFEVMKVKITRAGTWDPTVEQAGQLLGGIVYQVNEYFDDESIGEQDYKAAEKDMSIVNKWIKH
ncbi:uncharacterized protein PAC_20066 [Phialocephala subalpina]|uniref:Uncharacterized protein n=1 Tax=Phialocephala subalpina TaxID=576137 RepID=A0A1L7XYY5_9HELO|nr:uncharacterized protein PAC_20066 [Phialocephala subalpina]